MQFCLLQRALKPKLIHLLLPAQFHLFLYKIGQNWSFFIDLSPINPYQDTFLFILAIIYHKTLHWKSKKLNLKNFDL